MYHFFIHQTNQPIYYFVAFPFGCSDFLHCNHHLLKNNPISWHESSKLANNSLPSSDDWSLNGFQELFQYVLFWIEIFPDYSDEFIPASFVFTIDMEKVVHCMEELDGSPHINPSTIASQWNEVLNGQSEFWLLIVMQSWDSISHLPSCLTAPHQQIMFWLTHLVFSLFPYIVNFPPQEIWWKIRNSPYPVENVDPTLFCTWLIALNTCITS